MPPSHSTYDHKHLQAAAKQDYFSRTKTEVLHNSQSLALMNGEVHMGFQLGNLREGDHLENIDLARCMS